jgi:hypothetical protein
MVLGYILGTTIARRRTGVRKPLILLNEKNEEKDRLNI